MVDLQNGEVIIDGRKVLGPSFKLIPGDENMSLVSQDYYVLDNHSVEENVFDKLIAYSDDYKRQRCDKLLRLLELQPLRGVKARFLSSGQKQRLAIARAIAQLPAVLLLDEPFSNLDKRLSDKLFAFIRKEVQKQKTAVLLITHIAEEALKFSDRIALMEKGRIQKTGDKWDLYYKALSSNLAQLLGDINWIHPEDMEKKKKASSKKIFLRPDKIKVIANSKEAEIKVQVISCVYNGKCYELLCETKSGRSLMIYHSLALEEGRKVNCVLC